MFLEESFILSCASYLLTFLYMVSIHLWTRRSFVNYLTASLTRSIWDIYRSMFRLPMQYESRQICILLKYVDAIHFKQNYKQKSIVNKIKYCRNLGLAKLVQICCRNLIGQFVKLFFVYIYFSAYMIHPYINVWYTFILVVVLFQYRRIKGQLNFLSTYILIIPIFLKTKVCKVKPRQSHINLVLTQKYYQEEGVQSYTFICI